MKKYLKYVITFAVGLVIAFLVLIVKDIFNLSNKIDIIIALCDSAFVSGVLIMSFGLLCLADKGGTFDMLAYGIRRFFGIFRRDVTKVKYRTFYEYRKAMQERNIHFGYLLIIGGIYLVTFLVFLIIYYSL